MEIRSNAPPIKKCIKVRFSSPSEFSMLFDIKVKHIGNIIREDKLINFPASRLEYKITPISSPSIANTGMIKRVKRTENLSAFSVVLFKLL